jgi:hypothetical protein
MIEEMIDEKQWKGKHFFWVLSIDSEQTNHYLQIANTHKQN